MSVNYVHASSLLLPTFNPAFAYVKSVYPNHAESRHDEKRAAVSTCSGRSTLGGHSKTGKGKAKSLGSPTAPFQLAQRLDHLVSKPTMVHELPAEPMWLGN